MHVTLHHQIWLVTILSCLATSFREHQKKCGAYFTALWAWSPVEQPVHKSWSGADLWQPWSSCRQNGVLSQEKARDGRTETKKMAYFFNLFSCSLSFSVLMDCAHTLQIQSQGFEGQIQREAWCFTLTEHHQDHGHYCLKRQRDNGKALLAVVCYISSPSF